MNRNRNGDGVDTWERRIFFSSNIKTNGKMVKEETGKEKSYGASTGMEQE